MRCPLEEVQGAGPMFSDEKGKGDKTRVYTVLNFLLPKTIQVGCMWNFFTCQKKS